MVILDNPQLAQPDFVCRLRCAASGSIAFLSIDSFHLLNAQGLAITTAPCQVGGAISFSRDSKYVAAICNGDGHKVDVRAADTGLLCKSITGLIPYRDFSFSPTEDRLSVLDGVGKLVIRETINWQVIAEESLFEEAEFRDYLCSYSPDGQFLICSGPGTLVIVDTRTLGCIRRIPVSSHIQCVGFSRDSSMVATGCSDGTIQLWNWPTLTPHANLSGHRGSVKDIEFIMGNRLLSVGDDGTTRLWSANHLREFGVLEHRQFPGTTLSISTDRKVIYVGYNSLNTGAPGLSMIRVQIP
jgi:WD40 repeat protein